MQCPICRTTSKKFGKPKGFQRYHCPSCRKCWSERRARPLGAMRLPVEKAELVLHLLTEGCAVRAIERITGVERRTILRLLVQVGEGCERLLPELVKGVAVEDVQADEVWGYVRCKEGTKTRKNIQDPEAGDAYCWIGLERHSKLVLARHLGRRTKWNAHDFMEKLSASTAERFQLTTDGFNAYPDAVDYSFGSRVDYPMLVKEFGSEGGDEARRYAPARLIGAEKITVAGVPDEAGSGGDRGGRGSYPLMPHYQLAAAPRRARRRARRGCASASYPQRLGAMGIFTVKCTAAGWPSRLRAGAKRQAASARATACLSPGSGNLHSCASTT
jgi:transposase-like protein/IS1 family transposase